MRGRAGRGAGGEALSVEQGTVFVVSAPSGAGKTTLCKRLLAEVPGIEFSVSYTTRRPRSGEREGIDYRFVDAAEFERRRRAGEFVEWAVVDGQTYGTSAVAVRQATAAGRDILLDIDTQGAESIRRLLPGALLIFILPPGLEALRERLLHRGTEGAEAVERRLGLARAEVAKAPMYDYLIVNEDLDTAFDELRAIIVAARCRRERRAGRVRQIAAGFSAIRAGER